MENTPKEEEKCNCGECRGLQYGSFNGICDAGGCKCHTPQPITSKEWKDSFDKWWNDEETINIFIEKCTIDDFERMSDALKLKIAELLKSQREELVEKGKGLLRQYSEAPLNVGKYKNRRDRKISHARVWNYNKAIQDYQSIIKDK